MTIRIRIQPWGWWLASRFTTLDKARVWVWMSVPLALRWLAGVARLSSGLSAALGLWRFGYDLGWAQPFFLAEGVMSHWQVYAAIAAGLLVMGDWLAKVEEQAAPRTVESLAARRPAMSEGQTVMSPVWSSAPAYSFDPQVAGAVVLTRRAYSETASVR
jgi:hypothetical protein